VIDPTEQGTATFGEYQTWYRVRRPAGLRVRVPGRGSTLLASGRHDEATPACVQPFADRIPDVRWRLFEHSSHLPHVEETDAFNTTVAELLSTVD
jgi:L-proline amide hydrolase